MGTIAAVDEMFGITEDTMLGHKSFDLAQQLPA
jgi:hypothetical protein